MPAGLEGGGGAAAGKLDVLAAFALEGSDLVAHSLRHLEVMSLPRTEALTHTTDTWNVVTCTTNACIDLPQKRVGTFVRLPTCMNA